MRAAGNAGLESLSRGERSDERVPAWKVPSKTGKKMEERTANRVREFRKGRGMTQEELASRMDVSRQTIISIEKGKYIPSLPLALRISRFFECSTDEMFFPEED